MEHNTNQDRPANLNALKVFLEKAMGQYLAEAGSEEKFTERMSAACPNQSQEDAAVQLEFARNGLTKQAQKNTAQ